MSEKKSYVIEINIANMSDYQFKKLEKLLRSFQLKGGEIIEDGI